MICVFNILIWVKLCHTVKAEISNAEFSISILDKTRKHYHGEILFFNFARQYDI